MSINQEPARPGDEGPASGVLARAHLRVQHLYKISKLLTRFEGAERTIPEILAILAGALPARTALVILEAPDGRIKTLVWRAEGVSDDGLRAATSHARASYAYLSGADAGWPVDLDSEPAMTSAPPAQPAQPATAPRTESEERASLVLLPLVIERQRIFGALQIESAAHLEESDLWFVNAVVNQLAIALDRQTAIDARQAAAEAQRRMAEQGRDEIRDQLEFTHAVTGSIGEGVLAIDLRGTITFFNAAAERLLGRTEDDVLGRHVQEVVRIRRPDGTALPEDEHPTMRALRTGELTRSSDYLFSRRGGASFDVSCTSAPLSRAGQITGAVLVFQDIVEVKRAERAQRLFAEVSAALATSLDSSVTLAAMARLSVPALADLYFVDLVEEDGRVERLEPVSINPVNQGLAARIRQFTPRPGWETPQARVLRTGEPLLLTETTASASDGIDDDPIRWTAGTAGEAGPIMVVPLLGRVRTLGALTFVTAESGRLYSAADLAVAQEVARRAAMAIDNARMYEKAQRAIRTRDDFLAVVSHDLRNPLGSIMTATALLMQALSSDEGQAHHRRRADVILRAADRMLRIINDLLDVAAIEAERLSMNKQRHPVGALIYEAIEMEELLALHKHLVLQSELPDGDSFEVICDHQRVLQVFANLIGNAIKFTKERGTITLRAVPSGDKALFSVSDTGPGIPPEQLPHIFDRFWQAGETAREGTGLGLTIAKSFIEAHGGTIWAESRLGVGTTFFFTLPLATP